MADPDPIVLELRRVREQRGLSQMDVWRLTDGQVTKASLGAYERGDRIPPIPALRRWAAVFGLTLTLTPAPADETEPDL